KAAARGRARAGTTIRFRLNAAATVRLTVQRRLAGRRAGGRCVAPRRARPGARRCVRSVAAGRLVRRDLAAGAQRVRFSGRIGRRALRPGRYRLTAVAVDSAGRRSAPRRAAFRVLSPR
ncbi:MAG: hypothetical protein GXY03_11055, partial [Solirubrobacterales bacterium]|nr:hypothetical protein [Solirubrobacterales bacterium]